MATFPQANLQIRLRKGAREHVLHWDGSSKGLAIPSIWAKCSAASYCKLQLPLFFIFCDVNHQCQAMSELCVDPLCHGEQPNVIARQLDFCYITRKRVFLLLCQKKLVGTQPPTGGLKCNHHKPSCGVRSSWESRKTPPVSLLPFSPLWLQAKSQKLTNKELNVSLYFYFRLIIQSVNLCAQRTYSSSSRIGSVDQKFVLKISLISLFSFYNELRY